MIDPKVDAVQPDALRALLDPENAPARHGQWRPAHRPMGEESVELVDDDGCSLWVEPWEVAALVNMAVDDTVTIVADARPVVMDDYMAGYRQAKSDAAALEEATRAYLDAEREPAFSWVRESQEARMEGRPNREIERMERVNTARVHLRSMLAGDEPRRPVNGKSVEVTVHIADLDDVRYALETAARLEAAAREVVWVCGSYSPQFVPTGILVAIEALRAALPAIEDQPKPDRRPPALPPADPSLLR